MATDAQAAGESERWLDGDAYLFDIDGTLLNSRDGVHYSAFHSGMRKIFGVASKIDGVPLHGNTDLGIVRAVLEREGVDTNDFAARLPALIAHMGDEVARNARDLAPEICPSVVELLSFLQSRGKLLGVVSGNLERIGWLKLEAAGLRPFFAFGSFSDGNEKREDIFRAGLGEARQRIGDAARIYLVGDTPADIQAARAAGAPILAIATGTYGVEELAAHSPDACFSCCTSILGGE